MSFTYDLYVHERGRWILESSFGIDQRTDALELARRIEEHRSAEGIQVIRERFDADTGRIERSTVYNTWRRRKARAWREARGEGPGPYADVLPAATDDEDDLLTEALYPSLDAGPEQKPSGGDHVFAKLIGIAVASFGLATLVTVVHSAAAGSAGF